MQSDTIMNDDRVERFPALVRLPEVNHLFIARIPGIDIRGEREVVLPRFAAIHEEIRSEHGLSGPMVSAQQIHGGEIATVSPAEAGQSMPGVDGLITSARELVLAIYVADCCAVYLVDPVTPAIGLLHSGKKGTEANITGRAIQRMAQEFGSDPEKMLVQLSPCIRPPLYELDFAATIREQARAAGVLAVYDEGVCTGANVDRYYSYRVERGNTGRLLALLKIHAA